MSLKEFLKGMAKESGIVGAAAAIGAAAILAGECRDFRHSAQNASVPSVAPPTKAEEKAEAVILPCRDVQAIEPGKRERERLAEKYAKPEIAGLAREFEIGATAPLRTEILGERVLPEMPAGGTALLTLDQTGRVDVTVKPNPERLFELRSVYEFGALYGIGTDGEKRGRAWVAAEPLRFARLHLRAEAGVDLRAGQSDGYAMAGVVWRSR